MQSSQIKLDAPLYIASDHQGYQMKRRLVRYLTRELKVRVIDIGPKIYNPFDDYPLYTMMLAKHVVEQRGYGILLCANGIGVCMAANKVKNIRAGIGYNIYAARTMKMDDNTNILCLPSHVLSEDHAKAVVREWLTTPYSQARRHNRRLKEVDTLDFEVRGYSSVHGMVFLAQKLFLVRSVKGRGEEVLILMHRRLGQWDVPGGRIEVAESRKVLNFKKAFERELTEEIGSVKYSEPEIFGVFSHKLAQSKKSKGAYVALLLFSARFKSGEPVLSPEHTEYKWVPIRDLKKYSFGDRNPMRDQFIKYAK